MFYWKWLESAGKTYIINNLAFKIEDGVMHDYLLPGFAVKPPCSSCQLIHTTARTQMVFRYGL